MLDKILESALKKIDTAKTSRQLQDSKVEFLGKDTPSPVHYDTTHVSDFLK
jgi:hypothetical protein